jgi:hypothetical protein
VQNQKTKAQTGTNSWYMNYPYPGDFFSVFFASNIYPVNNQNLPNINDPHLEREVDRLDQLPESQLTEVADDWAELDHHLQEQAYSAPIAVGASPKFVSERIDFERAVFNPVYFMVYSTLGYES